MQSYDILQKNQNVWLANVDFYSGKYRFLYFYGKRKLKRGG